MNSFIIIKLPATLLTKTYNYIPRRVRNMKNDCRKADVYRLVKRRLSTLNHNPTLMYSYFACFNTVY
jgi:hypothetical protein